MMLLYVDAVSMAWRITHILHIGDRS